MWHGAIITCVCICVHKYMCSQIFVFTNICVHKYMCSQIYVFTNICVHKYMCSQIFVASDAHHTALQSCVTYCGPGLSLELYIYVYPCINFDIYV